MNKFVGVAVFVVCLLCVTSVAAAPSENPGDVNGDGRVDAVDLAFVSSQILLPKPLDLRADLNGDLLVNIYDLIQVTRNWGITYPTAQPPGNANFSITTAGPRSMNPGGSIGISLDIQRTPAANEGVEIVIENLPSGFTADYRSLAYGCCGPYPFWLYSTPNSVSIAINSSSAAAPGLYTPRIKFRGRQSGQEYVLSYPITVRAVVPIAKQAYSPAPALQGLEQYESDMLVYGQKHCNLSTILDYGIWDGSVQYYDGERLYYQLAAYTNNATWDSCAQYVEQAYRDGYVLLNNGQVQGYRIFPHGLYRDYRATGDLESRRAIELLAQTGWALGSVFGDSEFESREVAYGLNTILLVEALGQPSPAKRAIRVDTALGHLDQWFVTRNAQNYRPFMVALTAEALIRYHEKTGDPRVVPLLALSLDTLWNEAWNSQVGSFEYNHDLNSSGAVSAVAPDLNGLIAPAYGWLYLQTGEEKWRTRGDAIFAGSKDAWLVQGKQYTQTYRWSMVYTQWRQGIPVSVDWPLPSTAQ